MGWMDLSSYESVDECSDIKYKQLLNSVLLNLKLSNFIRKKSYTKKILSCLKDAKSFLVDYYLLHQNDGVDVFHVYCIIFPTYIN